MYAERLSMYQRLEKERGSKILVYVTGDRQNLEVQIGNDVLDFFVDHLDRIGVTDRISLYLYTRGGNTLAAWSLINLIRTFCDQLEVIVPSKAQSAGTLMSLGANRIVMTKQAVLGPIDPSVNTPLNPHVQGNPQARVPVNVENINGFIDFGKQTLGNDTDLQNVFLRLAESIHPMVLGQAHRSRSQIRMLAQRLLHTHINDDASMNKILDFLCSESGSHDYTINRREAAAELGLPIETPSQQLYELIKGIYDDIADELSLRTPYDPNLLLAGNQNARYSLPRGLIESVEGGSDVFISEGHLTLQQIQGPKGILQNAIHDQRQFEGWRHRDA